MDRLLIPASGSKFVPFYGRGRTAPYAFAIPVHDAQTTLCLWISLACSLSVPVKGFLVVPKPWLLRVQPAQTRLCIGIALLGSFRVPRNGSLEILLNAVSMLVAVSDIVLRCTVSFSRRAHQPLETKLWPSRRPTPLHEAHTISTLSVGVSSLGRLFEPLDSKS